MKRLWSWLRARPERWMLVLLVGLTLSKGIAWVSLYPLWKIADEPGQFDHIQFRAEHGLRGPVWAGHKIDPTVAWGSALEVRVSWKAAQAYYRDSYSKLFSSVPEETKLAQLAKDPASHETDGQMSALGYPGFYYTLSALPYRAFRSKSIINRVYAIRLISMLFGLMAVVATFFAGRVAFAAPEPAFVAAMVVDLQPMFSQQTAAVSNDAAIFGLCALAFLFQVRLFEKPRIADGALLGASVALAIYTKGAGWVMLLTSGILFAWLGLSNWRSVYRAAAASVGGFTVIMLIGRLWPATRPRGVPLPLSPGSLPYSLLDIPGDLPAMVTWMGSWGEPYREYLFRTTFGQFSWLEFWLGTPWLTALAEAWPLISFGLVGALVAGMFIVPEALWWKTRPMAFACVTSLVTVLAVIYVEYHDGSSQVGKNVVQGRNFLFAGPAFALLIVLALGSLVPKRLRGLTLAMVVTAALCLNAGAFLCVMRQHYGG